MNAQTENTAFQAIIANQYREDGREALATARKALERALREIDKYTEWYEQAESAQDMAKNLNWAINELASNVLGNARLDMLALAQANLAALKK